jgi:pantoate--beta-alanine ligase
MSSRNSYLSAEERVSALSLKKGLHLASALVATGEKDPGKIKNSVRELILNHPFTEIDYITICDPEKLTDIERVDGPSLLALAVRVGKTRLIDNIILREH